MAGIYIHIPFCKTRCLYCDFFSSTSVNETDRYVDALCRELELQKKYFGNEPLKTIYFGGGTPSQLPVSGFKRIFSQINESFPTGMLEEVTLEANPDDLNPDYLGSLRELPFNRISMGIQSFEDSELLFLNRRHDAKAAIQAVGDCKKAGFDNISIDLMYGLPGQSLDVWESNLRQAIELDVQHISAYHLIYEEGTRLYKLLDQGKVSMIDDGLSLQMFEMMIDRLNEAGFEHYEISNFARKGYYSKHNSSYWDGTHYLGVGASAHSYNGTSRHWNVSSMAKYMYSVEQGKPLAEIEYIDERTAYNDFILTRMRTSRGIDPDEINTLFGTETGAYFRKQISQYITRGLVEQKGNFLKLSREGIFVSDGIMSDLMLIE